MELKFRQLEVSEIEVRVGSVSKTGSGVSLLLYKDARVDQRILDEAVGAVNWEKSYRRDEKGRLFCKVSIWDDEKKQFVSKEDVGVESYAEKEKGEASDSFKRACFCWGIGRELYSVPFLWINSADCKITSYKDGKYTCNDYFEVRAIEYGSDCNVSYVEIYVKSSNKTISFGRKSYKSQDKMPSKKTTKVEECISMQETDPVEDYSINPECANTNPGAHKISFSCSRKGRTIQDIYDKDKEGEMFLRGILKYAASNPSMQPDEQYVREFLEKVTAA